MGSVGGQMALQLIEYAKCIELTDNEWNHNLIEDLNQLVSQQILLVNDYYTFRKELNENDNKFEEMRHSFPILVQRHGLSLQQSVNKINEMIKSKDNQIMDKIKTIENCEQLKTSDVLEYVNGVQQFLGGYWRHAVTARRYHGLNFTGVVPPEGYFLYDNNQTIIKPIDNKTMDFKWNKVVPQNVQPITY